MSEQHPESHEMIEATPTHDAAADEPRESGPVEVADAASEPRVIHIGLPAVGLLALAVAAIALGYWLGRGLNAASAPPVSQAADSPLVVTSKVVQPGGGQGFGVDPGHPLLFQAAPDFTLTNLASGESESLSGHKGKPVMVNFWATWCLPCRMEMPWLQAAHDTYADQGLVVLAVNAGEKVPEEMALPTIQSFVQQMGLTFPVLVGDLAQLYSVQETWSVWGLPASFMIDANGTVVDAHTGMYPSQADLNATIESVLAEESS